MDPHKDHLQTRNRFFSGGISQALIVWLVSGMCRPDFSASFPPSPVQGLGTFTLYSA